MEMDIEALKFQLKEKKDRLNEIGTNTFIYNPMIAILLSEISELETQIEEFGGTIDDE